MSVSGQTCRPRVLVRCLVPRVVEVRLLAPFRSMVGTSFAFLYLFGSFFQRVAEVRLGAASVM